MARYKHINTSPRFLAVDLEAQLLPGTFERALNHLLDHEIDRSAFDTRFNNDETGASSLLRACSAAAKESRSAEEESKVVPPA